MIKAVIFDADGPLYYRTGDVADQKQKLLQNYGYQGDIQNFETNYDNEKFKGYIAEETPAEMFRIILASIGLDVSLKKAQTFADAFDALQSQVTATPDARDVLKELKAECYSTCVLTDSLYSTKVKWPWFERLGLKPYLDDMVSSIDIKKLKSTPEAYQTCLDRLHVAAADAVFVGHQQYEMDGAKAAEVISIAVLPIATPDIRSDYTVDSLSELPALLRQLTI
ncbi:MAG TPA: HAD family hydrolase [Candidatus Saccharimonadales bacterium]|jgi:FMN phosphatase YigB (HAD superfamily)